MKPGGWPRRCAAVFCSTVPDGVADRDGSNGAAGLTIRREGEAPCQGSGRMKIPRVALLVKSEVEMWLLRNGWHLDAVSAHRNLIAVVKGHHRVLIQAITTDGRGPDAQWLRLGFAARYLQEGLPIFNPAADAVVAVSYNPPNSRFVVMPVGFAETLCRLRCDYLMAVPPRTGGQRSPAFPIWLPFTADRGGRHQAHFACLKRNVLRFESAWDVLSEPLEKLHETERWPLLE